MRSIDYGFRGGDMQYQTTTFNNDISIGKKKTMPILDAPESTQEGKEHIERIRAEFKSEVEVAQLTKGDDFQQIEYALLNHEQPENNGVIVYNMGIGGNFYHPVGQREIEVLAAANPNQQIMVINNTGSERASLIPRYMMARMKESGSYKKQGEWMLQILGDKLARYNDEIALWGNSAGARVALGMAAAFGAAGQRVACGVGHGGGVWCSRPARSQCTGG